MSNYTKSTDFTAKDSLPSGDSQKVIRGSEFDTEFSAIATAVNSKADKSGDTVVLTAGTVSAPSLTTVSDTNTGIYFPAADKVAFATGGTQRVIVDDLGNVGIGTSSPSVKLDVRSAAVHQAYFQSTEPTGTAGIRTITSNGTAGILLLTYGPSYASGSIASVGTNGSAVVQTGNAPLYVGTDIGISQPVYLGTNGITRAIIDASGNLGIGTSSPDTKLTVTVADTAVSTRFKAVTGVVRFRPYVDTTFGAIIDSSNAAESAYLPFTLIGSTLRLFGGGGTGAIIDSSGNLGLGVTPSAWGANYKALQFPSGGIGAYSTSNIAYAQNAYDSGVGAWKYLTTGAASGVYNQSLGAHEWYTAPSGTAGNAITFTQAMTLDASGRFFVGTTSGSAGFNLNSGATNWFNIGASNTSSSFGAFYKGGTTNVVGYIGTDDGGIVNGGTGDNFGIRAEGALLLLAGSSERARITSGGQFLVGLTSSSGWRTSFKAETSGVVGCSLFNVTEAADYPVGCVNEATSGNNQFVWFLTEAAGSSARGSIEYNRGAGLVAYNTTSDYRAKDIIGPVQNPGAAIDALKVYEGRMKGATQTRPMLVAHEAQEHAPYAVSGVKDELNEDGTPKFQQMDVSSLVPLLLAEIQSLRARVATLENN